MRCTHKCTGILWMCFCKPQATHLFFRQTRSPTLIQMIWPNTPKKQHYTKKIMFLIFFSKLHSSHIWSPLWFVGLQALLRRLRARAEWDIESAVECAGHRQYKCHISGRKSRVQHRPRPLLSRVRCVLSSPSEKLVTVTEVADLCVGIRGVWVWITEKSVNNAWCSDQLGTMQRDVTTDSHGSEEEKQMVLRKNLGNKKT